MIKKISVLSLCLLMSAAFSMDVSAEVVEGLKSINLEQNAPGDSINKERPRRGRRVRRGHPGRTVRRGHPGRRVRRHVPGRRVRRPIPRRVRRPIPRPVGRRYARPVVCRADLVTYRNYSTARFFGQSRGYGSSALRTACNRALRKCQNYKVRTYSRGRCIVR